MTVSVGEVLSKVKRILQEELGHSGVRWADAELLHWLNDGYRVAFAMNPLVSAATAVMTLAAGTDQRLGSADSVLLNVIRNVTPEVAVAYPALAAQEQMRALVRGRYQEVQTFNIEFWMPDAAAPFHFTVFPPARSGTRLEVYKADLPEPHVEAVGVDSSPEPVRVRDQYAPALIDYVLYRAFAKDAEAGANLNRANLHYQSFMALVGAGLATQPSRGG